MCRMRRRRAAPPPWPGSWPRAGGGRAVLSSPPRMAPLSRCDRILVLERGRIVEEGTHDELLSRAGAYFDLYSRQMLARELEAAPWATGRSAISTRAGGG